MSSLFLGEGPQHSPGHGTLGLMGLYISTIIWGQRYLYCKREAENCLLGFRLFLVFGIKEGSSQGQSSHVGENLRDLHCGLPSLFADLSFNFYFVVMGRDAVFWDSLTPMLLNLEGCLLKLVLLAFGETGYFLLEVLLYLV